MDFLIAETAQVAKTKTDQIAKDARITEEAEIKIAEGTRLAKDL